MASLPEQPIPVSERSPLSEQEPESVVAPRQQDTAWWRFGGLVKTIRPHQWVKNVFVLAPVFFAKDLFDPRLALRAAGAFGVFCLLAGAVYTINDIADAEADRLHPVKRFRPIASGRVTVKSAKILAATLVVLGLAGAFYGPLAFFAVAALYFLQNLAYSFKLKEYAYVDVVLIAAGFVLRVLGGGYGVRIQLSVYLLVCTALLALFLGFGKRRHELTAGQKRAKKQRAALSRYSTQGLDAAMSITGIATIATYVAYTVDPTTKAYFGSDKLWLTSIFVVLAVLRFLHLVRSRPRAESPTQEMLRDGPFVAAVLVWVMVVIWILYQLKPG
ncbi:MAG TPA: decaprenyl-phosphate phosphoribosyltransferase [Polyangiaceae bacterium]|jgi:4-hydroxybenzoate polyprenyltransferase|nr:decaprenyl-phosphate phosphoribosyltransferase [Polyangiaceae bacterium]